MTTALQRWDRRWVPVAAQRLRRTMAASRRRFGAQSRTVAGAVQEEPALAGSIVAVLVAAILIATVGEQGVGDEPRPGVVVPHGAAMATLGPAPGASVSTYLSRAEEDLRHLGQTEPARPTFALVDLRQFRTAAQVRSTFSGLAVVRVYVRVPSHLPTEVRSVPLTSLDRVEEGVRTVAQVAAATARSYAALLKAFHPRSREDRLTRKRYAEQRRAAAFEAHRLARTESCKCVFALVVQETYPRLVALADRPDVRVVDPASPVVPLTGLTVRPLEPGVTTVVPRTGLLGG